MIKWMRCCLMMLVCAAGAMAETETSEESPTGLAIAAVGELSGEHQERIRAFVERNSGIATRRIDAPDTAGESLGEILDALADLNSPEHACVVFLYAGDQVFEEHAVYRYESGVGIVNAALMKTDDEEQYLRRLEKLSMRSVGLLMGVEMVPNPQSAMWSYRTMNELDAMGRNFDPPSLMRLQQQARDRDIPLMKGSPFLLLEPRE